jgi:hypothetical protein
MFLVDRAQHSSLGFLGDLLQERSLSLVWLSEELVADILPPDRGFCRSCSKCLPFRADPQSKAVVTLNTDIPAPRGLSPSRPCNSPRVSPFS